MHGGTITSGLRAAQVGNPDLKWETSTQTNIGVDYGFAQDRVTGAVEFYQKDTKDLLLEISRISRRIWRVFGARSVVGSARPATATATSGARCTAT